MSSRFVLAWLLLGLWCTRGTADDLGRLFFSPEERAALEAIRTAATLPPPPLSAREISHLPTVPEAEVPPPPALTLNGIVTRSHGPATLWLNGSAQDARSPQVPGAAHPRIRIDRNAIEIALDATRPAQRMKAGQTLESTRAGVVEAHDVRPDIRPDIRNDARDDVPNPIDTGAP